MADDDGLEEGGSGGGGKGKFLLILLLLLLAAGAAYYYLNQEPEKEPEIIREGPPPLENPLYLELGTFIINLKDGKYYLKTTMQLAFTNAAAKAWMEGRLPIVKDLIISHLQELTSRQLNEARTRQLLRRDLQIKLNSLFPNLAPWEDTAPVKRILFSEFYQQ
ncbi:MAG: flagellar basal body-associated FliL family protein [SAR324 cluster bacterium]|nr:flagellar basal body-associated FliL family protein [SAR324 cluster bacterium]